MVLENFHVENLQKINADVPTKTRYKNDLVTHVKLKHGTETHGCSVCAFRTKSDKYLKKHVASQHAARRHACAICDVACGSGAELKAHRAAAHPEVKYTFL